MAKNTSEKVVWWRFSLLFILFSSLWFFLFYWINRQIHDTGDVLFYGTPASSYWVYFICAVVYGLTTWGIYFTIKQGIHEKSFQSFKKGAQFMMTLAGLPLLISLPFLYLGVTHALVVSDEKIQFSSFWSLKETEYSWEKDVQGVAIDYSITTTTKIPHKRHFNGRYILHFKDGKKIDMWEGILEGNLPTIKKIDEMIQKKQIPFAVQRKPSAEEIDEFFNNKDTEFINDLYSR
ncbi:hypothetical protein ACIQXQ_10425 [Peribacillus sp. NPDC097198]|uniref:hypothetical protein n=1 Tax=Peribacillus sp. NPDC097198 TaxID=3364397 RepID=UPI00382F4158